MIRAICLAATLALPLNAQTALPFDLGGAFELIDQTGATRTQADPDGKLQLLFFGYANCREICSATLPLMAQIVDQVAEDGVEISPVMITVDPARDTIETLGPALTMHHEGFVGLTGSEAALDVAYKAFSIEKEEVFFDPEYGPVYAHGSFIYLLDEEGEVKSLLPPILAPERIAEIATGYLKK